MVSLVGSMRESLNSKARSLGNEISDGLGDFLVRDINIKSTAKACLVSAVIGVGTIAGGCGETYSAPGHMNGSRAANLSSKDIKYGEEVVNLHGTPYIFQKNTNREKGELNFYMVKEAEIEREWSLGSEKKYTLTSEVIYIPTLFNEINSISLTTDGPKGVNIQRSRQRNSNAAVDIHRVDQSNWDYNFEKIKISGELFFVPYYPNSGKDVPLMLIPESGTKLKIKNSGQVTLKNDDGVYLMETIDRGDYNRRGD